LDRILKSRKVLVALLAGTACLAFVRTLGNDFVPFDDGDYLTQNLVVHQGLTWKGTLWAFTTFEMGNWHPLTWLTHMLDWQLFGAHAGGHHGVGLLIFLATVAVVFLWLDEMTGERARSAAVTALFALHPLRVESVAWASERKDLLCAFFFVLTCWAHVRRVRKGGNGSWVALWTLLALMSKPMAVTLPVVLLILDFWPLRRREKPWALVFEKLPLIVLSGVSSAVTMFAQVSGGAVAEGFHLDAQVARASLNVLRYLGLTFWPVGLIPLHPFDYTPAVWKIVLAMALLFAITAAAWQLYPRRPAIAAGWAWFLVTLLPVIGLVQAGLQSVADRYTYLPHIGLAVAVVWAVPEPSPRWRNSAALLFGGLAAALAMATFVQVGYWRDARALFTHTLDVSPGNPLAEFVLGGEAMKTGDLAEAEARFRATLKKQPNAPRALLNLGIVLLKEGRTDEANRAFALARYEAPMDVDVSMGYACAAARVGRLDEAIAEYRALDSLDQEQRNTALQLGVLLDQAGQHEEGLAYIRRAVKLAEDDPATHAALATALARGGRFDEAIPEMEAALKLQPDYPGMRQMLGYAREDAAKLRQTHASRSPETR